MTAYGVQEILDQHFNKAFTSIVGYAEPTRVEHYKILEILAETFKVELREDVG